MTDPALLLPFAPVAVRSHPRWPDRDVHIPLWPVLTRVRHYRRVHLRMVLKRMRWREMAAHRWDDCTTLSA